MIQLKPLEMNNKVKELLLQKEALKRDIESGGFDEVESSIAEQNLQDLVQELEEVISNENKRMFVANISSVEDMDGKFSNNKGWKLKRKLAPKENSLDAAVAMKNKNGTLITDRTQLEKMYVEFYQDRMAPNQITPGLENLEHHKEELFNLRMILAEGKKSPDWTADELDKVLKSLKGNKARDIFGHTYELFKYGGYYLKESLLLMYNSVKNSDIYPDIFSSATLTSIAKSNSKKHEMSGQRGIYNLAKVRSILDKLLYNSNYETLDDNMSSSNIGARKGRNIRDHLLVVNSVLFEVVKKNEKVDAEILDVKSCFDKLWAAETANDAFDNGLTNDHFVLSSKSNNKCNVSIKLPWGKVTKPVQFENIEMQGSVELSIKMLNDN